MIDRMQRLAPFAILLFAICPLVGCERDVAEVQTPTGEVEVEENLDGGLEVEAED